MEGKFFPLVIVDSLPAGLLKKSGVTFIDFCQASVGVDCTAGYFHRRAHPHANAFAGSAVYVATKLIGVWAVRIGRTPRGLNAVQKGANA